MTEPVAPLIRRLSLAVETVVRQRLAESEMTLDEAAAMLGLPVDHLHEMIEKPDGSWPLITAISLAVDSGAVDADELVAIFSEALARASADRAIPVLPDLPDTLPVPPSHPPLPEWAEPRIGPTSPPYRPITPLPPLRTTTHTLPTVSGPGPLTTRSLGGAGVMIDGRTTHAFSDFTVGGIPGSAAEPPFTLKPLAARYLASAAPPTPAISDSVWVPLDAGESLRDEDIARMLGPVESISSTPPPVLSAPTDLVSVRLVYPDGTRTTIEIPAESASRMFSALSRRYDMDDLDLGTR